MDGGHDDLSETVRKCIDLVGESMDILADIERDLGAETDDLIPDMRLCNLYDLVDDAAESSRLRRAERGFLQRHAGDPSPL